MLIAKNDGKAAIGRPFLFRRGGVDKDGRRAATGEKGRRLLGWMPRPRKDAIIAIRLGLLKDSPKKALYHATSFAGAKDVPAGTDRLPD